MPKLTFKLRPLKEYPKTVLELPRGTIISEAIAYSIYDIEVVTFEPASSVLVEHEFYVVSCGETIDFPDKPQLQTLRLDRSEAEGGASRVSILYRVLPNDTSKMVDLGYKLIGLYEDFNTPLEEYIVLQSRLKKFELSPNQAIVVDMNWETEKMLTGGYMYKPHYSELLETIRDFRAAISRMENN